VNQIREEKSMSSPLSRRRFLKTASVGIAATVAEPVASSALSAEPLADAATTPQRALQLLIAGNRRWVTGRTRHPHQSIKRRLALRHEQHPFATVFSCLDSRVPPEVVFDRGIGDLAVIRTGAQVLDEGVVLGSIEFSPDHLHAPLLLVMGHQRCGAVIATIHAIEHHLTAPGHIKSVVDALRPAYHVAKPQTGDLVDNMVRAQTKLAVQALKADHLIEELIAEGKLGVAGGYYSLDTGAVSIIA
jgi:carbonic anhydrase